MHTNEILDYLTQDPFEDYAEQYDQGLFQFSANEIDLYASAQLLDSIQYNDTVYLTQNNIIIEGYIKGIKNAIDGKTIIIRLQSSSIICKTNIEFPFDAEMYDPLSLVKKVNSQNGSVFNSISGAFDEGSASTKILYQAEYSSGLQSCDTSIVSMYESSIPNLWKIVLKLTDEFYGFTKTKYFYWYTQSSTISMSTSNDTGKWAFKSRKPNNFSDQFLKYLTNSLLPYLVGEDMNIQTIDIIEIQEQTKILVLIGYNNTLKVFIISNYSDDIMFLSCSATTQCFSNLLSDLCFIYNSYFYVRNFTNLYIKAINTGIIVHDISSYRDYILPNISQTIEPIEYEDYTFKTVSDTGENAFGLSEAIQNKINNSYKSIYVGKLVTSFRIKRAKNEAGVTDLPLMKIQDQIVDGDFDLGLIKNIGYENEGLVYVFTLVRYLDDMRFNKWWNL